MLAAQSLTCIERSLSLRIDRQHPAAKPPVPRKAATPLSGLFHPCFCREWWARGAHPNGKKMVCIEQMPYASK
jgi:hypothetical protein